MSKRRNPRVFVAALVASTVFAVGVKLYAYYKKETLIDANKYTNKSIALTLSHSILSSKLPLNDILLNSENVTFILPPNLSLDDLEVNIEQLPEATQEDAASTNVTTSLSGTYSVPRTLLKNYKLLNCSNLQGYFNIIKNLKPDMLLVCSDDLGIDYGAPKDLGRFVKEVINIDQNEDITTKVLPIFFG